MWTDGGAFRASVAPLFAYLSMADYENNTETCPKCNSLHAWLSDILNFLKPKLSTLCSSELKPVRTAAVMAQLFPGVQD